MFTVHLGPRPVVMLCGYTAVKEALVDQADDFGARAEMPMTQRTSKGCGEEHAGDQERVPCPLPEHTCTPALEGAGSGS